MHLDGLVCCGSPWLVSGSTREGRCFCFFAHQWALCQSMQRKQVSVSCWGLNHPVGTENAVGGLRWLSFPKHTVRQKSSAWCISSWYTGLLWEASLQSSVHRHPWGNYCNSLEFFSSLSGATQMKGFASFIAPNCRAVLFSAFQSVSVEIMIRTPFLKKELARLLNLVLKQKVC